MLTMLFARSDAHLVRRVLGGHRNDFEMLVRRYLPAVLATIKSILRNPTDAEDVAQECFITAYQKLDSLKAPEKFPGWLLTIARNNALNWQRKNKHEVPLSDTALESIPAVHPEPARHEMHEMLHHTLQEVDQEIRELLLLHYYAGYSLREISGMYAISRVAAAKRLQRAREALGAKLVKQIPEMAGSADIRKKSKKIAAAAFAAGVVWKVKPAHGMIMGFLLGAGKLAGAGVVVLTMAATAFFTAPTLFDWSPSFPANNTNTVKAQQASTAEDASPATDVQEREESVDQHPEPLYSLSNVLVTPLDQAVGGAQVKAERITWKPTELPPDHTDIYTAQSDDNGAFTLEDMPPGVYSVTATTRVFGGAHDFQIQENGEVRGPRNVKMYPMIRSYGLLVDASGEAVPDAVIYPVSHELFSGEEFDHVTVCGIRARSDSKGRFMFEGIIPGAWKLYIVAPGHQPFYTDYVPCYGLRSTVVIETPGALRGRIVDTEGNPIAGISGTVYTGMQARSYGDEGSNYRVSNSFTSDAAGAFEIASLPPDEYFFKLKDSALILASPNQKAAIHPGKTSDIALQLTNGGAVSGRVLNATTGAGIAEIELRIYSNNAHPPMSKEAVTNASGNYLFTGLPGGSYQLNLSPNDQFPMAYRDTVNVTVKQGETVTDQDISLVPPMLVKGVVVDTEDRPVARAKVDGLNEQGTTTSWATRITEEDGSFMLPFSEGGEISLLAKKDSFRSETVTVTLSAETPEVETVLTLSIAAGAGIEGVVRDINGKPVYNAIVWAYPFQKEGSLTPSDSNSGRTDPKGAFSITGLLAGKYTVTATMQTGRRLGTIDVDVANNQITRDVLIQEMPEGNLTIEGTLYYPTGLPCPVAALGLDNSQMVSSGALGRFTFTRLGPGNHTIYALSPGYSPLAVSGIAAGTQNLKLVLQKFAVLTGSVTNAQTGMPVTDFSVQYLMLATPPFDTGGIESGQAGFADPKGQFRMERIPVTGIQVIIQATGFATWQTTLKELISGADNHVDAVLSPAAGITGVVFDASGNVLPKVRVSASGTNTVTDANGAFSLDNLPAGEEIEIAFSCPGYASTSAYAVAGSGASITVTLVAGGTLRIHAFKDGQPLNAFSALVKHVEPEIAQVAGEHYFATRGGEIVAQNVYPGEVEITTSVVDENTHTLSSPIGMAFAIVAEGQETVVVVEALPMDQQEAPYPESTME